MNSSGQSHFALQFKCKMDCGLLSSYSRRTADQHEINMRLKHTNYAAAPSGLQVDAQDRPTTRRYYTIRLYNSVRFKCYLSARQPEARNF